MKKKIAHAHVFKEYIEINLQIVDFVENYKNGVEQRRVDFEISKNTMYVSE